MNKITNIIQLCNKIEKSDMVEYLNFYNTDNKLDIIWIGVKKLAKKYNVSANYIKKYFMKNIIDVTVHHKINKNADNLIIKLVLPKSETTKKMEKDLAKHYDYLQYPEDLNRIKSVLYNNLKISINLHDANAFWSWRSNQYDASWLVISTDAEILTWFKEYQNYFKG